MHAPMVSSLGVKRASLSSSSPLLLSWSLSETESCEDESLSLFDDDETDDDESELIEDGDDDEPDSELTLSTSRLGFGLFKLVCARRERSSMNSR